jgi:hypothetical protein
VSFQIFSFKMAFRSAVILFSPRLDMILAAGRDRSKARMYRFRCAAGTRAKAILGRG